jgi:hypothetical protein
MKKFYPDYSLPVDPVNTISLKIQSYIDKKKFMTENYLMRELVSVFSTQTDINNISFTEKQIGHIVAHTWKIISNDTASEIFEDFKNVDVITKEQFEALKQKEGNKTSKEMREYDKYFKLSITNSFETYDQALYEQVL